VSSAEDKNSSGAMKSNGDVVVSVSSAVGEPPADAAYAPVVAAVSEPANGSSFQIIRRQAPYDYVILTDCVFSVELAQALVNTILCCCGPRTTVICCHEIRDEVGS